jgi:hypothetical protein
LSDRSNIYAQQGLSLSDSTDKVGLVEALDATGTWQANFPAATVKASKLVIKRRIRESALHPR